MTIALRHLVVMCRCVMKEQVLSAVRELPRHHLEHLAVRALAELHEKKQEAATYSYFMAVLTGVMFGGAVAAAGFIAGALLR